MELSYLLTFFGGVAADFARKVFIPQTEEWLEGFLPHKRRAKDIQRNLMQLDVRERLKKMGYDPALASHVTEDSVVFERRLSDAIEAKRDAYAGVEADRLATQAETQAEMNQVAFDRLESADRLLSSAVERFNANVDLSENAKAALVATQKAWEAFRVADAEFEGLATAEGGSMQPLVHAMAMEGMTVDRIAHLNSLRVSLQDR